MFRWLYEPIMDSVVLWTAKDDLHRVTRATVLVAIASAEEHTPYWTLDLDPHSFHKKLHYSNDSDNATIDVEYYKRNKECNKVHKRTDGDILVTVNGLTTGIPSCSYLGFKALRVLNQYVERKNKIENYSRLNDVAQAADRFVESVRKANDDIMYQFWRQKKTYCDTSRDFEDALLAYKSLNKPFSFETALACCYSRHNVILCYKQPLEKYLKLRHQEHNGLVWVHNPFYKGD